MNNAKRVHGSSPFRAMLMSALEYCSNCGGLKYKGQACGGCGKG